MYVKLFGSILQSSIWAEDHGTVRMWVTLLLLADKDGVVLGSAPGLAITANCTLAETRTALKKLEEPDLDSGSPTYGGRRIEKVEGGWLLLNYEKYREIRTEAQLKAAARQRKKYHKDRDTSREVGDSYTDTDADTDTDTEGESSNGEIVTHGEIPTKPPIPSGEPPDQAPTGTNLPIPRDQHWTEAFVKDLTEESWERGRARKEAVVVFEFHRWRNGIKNRTVFTKSREQNTERLLTAYGLVRVLLAIEGQLIHPHFNQTDTGRSFRGYDNLFRAEKGHENIEKCSDLAIQDGRFAKVLQALGRLGRERGWTPASADEELFAVLQQSRRHP